MFYILCVAGEQGHSMSPVHDTTHCSTQQDCRNDEAALKPVVRGGLYCDSVVNIELSIPM